MVDKGTSKFEHANRNLCHMTRVTQTNNTMKE